MHRLAFIFGEEGVGLRLKLVWPTYCVLLAYIIIKVVETIVVCLIANSCLNLVDRFFVLVSHLLDQFIDIWIILDDELFRLDYWLCDISFLRFGLVGIELL